MAGYYIKGTSVSDWTCTVPLGRSEGILSPSWERTHIVVWDWTCEGKEHHWTVQGGWLSLTPLRFYLRSLHSPVSGALGHLFYLSHFYGDQLYIDSVWPPPWWPAYPDTTHQHLTACTYHKLPAFYPTACLLWLKHKTPQASTMAVHAKLRSAGELMSPGSKTLTNKKWDPANKSPFPAP